MLFFKVILSSALPFFKEWFMPKDAPYADSKERKSETFLKNIVVILIVSLSTLGLEYLDTRDQLSRKIKEYKSLEEKVTLKERQLIHLDGKLIEFKEKYEEAEVTLYRKEVAYNNLKEKYDECKQTSEEACVVTEVPNVPKLDIGSITDKLNKIRRDRQ